MPDCMTNPWLYRFGPFVFDARSGELSRDRGRVRLPGQAAALLEALLQAPGQVLTRDQLRARLWSSRTCVDFDHGLANAVQRLREALGDSAALSRYVETLPRRGFRFIAAVELISPADARPGSWPERRASHWRRLLQGTAAFALVGLTVALFVLSRPAPVVTGVASAAPPRLVVLPLADLTGDTADAYFVDGLTEELITHLGRLPPDLLVVIARESAMRSRSAPDLTQLGRELRVDYALTGSVRREADRVRVAARLVRVADGAQQWVGTFDRDRVGVLEVQSDIARQVAEALSLHLPAEWQSRPARYDTGYPAAREAYLRGRWFANQRTPASLSRAIDELRRAVDIDPQYVRGYAALATALHFGGAVGLMDQAEARRLTREAAVRALELDPAAGDALAVLAESRFRFGGEIDGVEAMFRRAAALRPQDSEVLHWLGVFLALNGDTSEALSTLEAARELDPLAAHLGADYAGVLHEAGRHQEAANVLQRTRELDPLFPKTYLVEASIAIDGRRYAEAITAMRRAIELSPDTPKYVASLARVYLAAGHTADAHRTLAELRALSRRVHVTPDLIRSVEQELAR